MGISELCIRRPVFATVLSLLMLLIGVVSYERLTVREYPSIDEPVVSVVTSYPGASASIIVRRTSAREAVVRQWTLRCPDRWFPHFTVAAPLPCTIENISPNAHDPSPERRGRG